MTDEVGGLAAAIIRRHAGLGHPIMEDIRAMMAQTHESSENQTMFLEGASDYPAITARIHGNGHDDGRIVLQGEISPQRGIDLHEDALYLGSRMPESWKTQAISKAEAGGTLSAILGSGCGSFDPQLGEAETIEFGGDDDVVSIALVPSATSLALLIAELGPSGTSASQMETPISDPSEKGK